MLNVLRWTVKRGRARRRWTVGRMRRASPTVVHTVLLLGFSGGVALWLRGLGWSWMLAYLCGINATTALAYGYDKLAAKMAGAPRVPERVLHLAAFAGGTPAALVAQKVIRHKTSKTSFQVVFWILATVQLALAVWLVARHLG